MEVVAFFDEALRMCKILCVLSHLGGKQMGLGDSPGFKP